MGVYLYTIVSKTDYRIHNVLHLLSPPQNKQPLSLSLSDSYFPIAAGLCPVSVVCLFVAS